MQFGYFDDANKEYVITRPDTPRSWSNYLGTTEYGAIITNNAGGYSFYKSAALGRFMRLRFNAVPMDQPGRYIYLHDHDSKDYWSASWQPVGKPLDEYKSECRHGSAYTVISSEYAGIRAETTYFVPLGKNFECWHVRLANLSGKPRRLSAFTYVEYAGNWSAFDDLINLQYTQHIVKMEVEDNIIDHGTNVNIPHMPDNFEEKDQGRHTFLALVGAEVVGYDTDRTSFIGTYRGYANPQVVEQGQCTDSLAVGDNACGVLQARISLAPGETKEFLVLMGVGRAREEGKRSGGGIRQHGEGPRGACQAEELLARAHRRAHGGDAGRRVEQHAEHVGPIQLPDHLRLVARGELDLRGRARRIGVSRHGAGHAGRDARHSRRGRPAVGVDDHRTGFDGRGHARGPAIRASPRERKAPRWKKSTAPTTACGSSTRFRPTSRRRATWPS